MENVPEASVLQDALTGALIGLVRAADGSSYGLTTEETDLLIVEALAAAHKTDSGRLQSLLSRVGKEKARLAPNCAACTASCGRTQDFDLKELRLLPEEIRDLKTRILMALQDSAVYIRSGRAVDRAHCRLFYKALFAIGDYWGAERLRGLLKELETAEPRLRNL